MSKDWTNTIAAVADVERADAKGQWQIGDAIAQDLAAMGYRKNAQSSTVEDSGKMPKATTFKECVEEVRASGFDDYTVEHLRKLYKTAQAFGHNERDPEISWATHVCAGTPNNLSRAAAALRKIGKTVTPINMQWMIREWRDNAMAGRREKHAAARVAKATAKARLKDAAEKQLAATTKAEKEAAQKERQEAKREEAEADKQILATAAPPRGDINAPPPEITALEVAALVLVTDSRADQIKKLEKRTLEELDQVLDQIGLDTKQRLIENYTRVTDLAHEMVGRLVGHARDKFQIVSPPSIGPYSAGEHDRMRDRINELHDEKRLLEIRVKALENEVEEATGTRELDPDNEAHARVGKEIAGLAGQARALLQHATIPNVESVKGLLRRIVRLCEKPPSNKIPSEEKKPALNQNLLPKALGLGEKPAGADPAIPSFLDRRPPPEPMS